MKRLFYILSIFLSLTACQHDIPMSVAGEPNAEVNFVMTRAGEGGGAAHSGNMVYDPIADTLYVVAEESGKKDTSIYYLKGVGYDTIYASDKPFYYEDVKEAEFTIFGYGNVGYKSIEHISPYPEFDQQYDSVFLRNNYVLTKNIRLSKIDGHKPMSASNHILAATLYPQFTLLQVAFGTNQNDDLVEDVVFLSDKGVIRPNVFNNAYYRAIVDPSNVRPPLADGEIPNADNSVVQVNIKRRNTGEKYTLYGGYRVENPITDYKGKKIVFTLALAYNEIVVSTQIEPWEVISCSGTANYIR